MVFDVISISPDGKARIMQDGKEVPVQLVVTSDGAFGCRPIKQPNPFSVDQKRGNPIPTHPPDLSGLDQFA